MEERYVEVPTHPVGIPDGDLRASETISSRGSQPKRSVGRKVGGEVRVMVRYVVEGEGPAVLLVHGLGASLAVWEENITSLAEGHTVYALDLPGQGKSDKPAELQYDAVSGAHFLVDFMDALGIRSATLIGNSAGGLITAICALTYPGRVEALVLVDSAGLGRQMAWFLRFASLPFLGELLHISGVRNTRSLIKSVFYEHGLARREMVDELVKVRNTPEAKRASLKATRSGVNLWGLRRSMMVLPMLKAWAKPLLIIWGREDRILPVSHAYRAASVLPNSRVHVIPRCGHWPQMERPQEFNSLVLRFLDGSMGDRE